MRGSKGGTAFGRHALVLAVGVAISVGAVATPLPRSAPASTDEASAPLQEPESLEIDRSQERMAEAVEDTRETAPSAEDPGYELPAGALDGNIDQPTDPSVLVDTDGDGAVTPPPTGVEGSIVPIDDRAAEQAAAEAAAAAGESATDGLGLSGPVGDPGDVVDRARGLDLSGFEPGEEIVELRTEESRTFTDEDGRLRTELWNEPVFVKDSDGDMVPADVSLEPGDDGRWRPEAVEGDMSFGSLATQDELGSFEFGDGQRLSWSLKGAFPRLGRPVGDHLLFEDVFAGVDLELQATTSGTKEVLVLENANAPAVYDFPLELTGVRAVLEDRFGAVRLVDIASGDTVGFIPSAWARDENRGPGGELLDPFPVAYELTGLRPSPTRRCSAAREESW